jgi:hypothetical protein
VTSADTTSLSAICSAWSSRTRVSQDRRHAGQPQLTESLIQFDEGSFRLSCRAISEIAIEGELTNQRIDLSEGQRHRGSAFEVTAQEAIGGHAQVERGLRGLLEDRWAVFLRQRKDAENATDARCAVRDDECDRSWC